VNKTIRRWDQEERTCELVQVLLRVLAVSFFCFTVNPPMKLHIIGKFSLASPTIILSVTSSTIIVLSLTAGD
jgi:hypothetical protein